MTATIIDLAVRGYLKIEEVDKEWYQFKHDWKLTKLPKEGALRQYERSLYSGLFKSGDEVKLSDLKNTFAERMSKVREQLMDDAMSQGWFTRKPGTVKVLWGMLGILVLAGGVALTILLAIETHAALLGVPVIIGGILLLVASRWMPKRTAKGYAVLRHTLGFKRFIDESEKHRAQFAERANIFSEYLPYAVVFGATEKWAKAFDGLARRGRHVVVVRVAARVQLRGVLERDRRLRGDERGHAHVVTRVERLERVQRRRLLRRWWRRRRRRLLVVADRRPAGRGPAHGR